MGTWVLSALFFVIVGSAVSGCTYDEAKYYCTHGDPSHPDEGGFSGPGLDGCVVGAHEVGPQFQTVADADSECDRRFNVRSIPYDGGDQWIRLTNEMIDRRNGCHYGAKGHLRYNTPQGLSGELDAGCVQRWNGDNVQCLPDAGVPMDPGPGQ